ALLDQLDPTGHVLRHVERRLEVYTRRAELYFLQGRLDERNRDLQAMRDLAETCGASSLQARASAAHARYANLDGRYEDAMACARDGLASLGSAGDPSVRSSLLAQLGFAHYFRGNAREALAPLQEALSIQREVDPLARAEVLSVMSYAHFLTADYGRSLHYRKQAYDLRRARGETARACWDLTDIGILHTRMYRLDRAEQALAEALDMARRNGSRPAESYALNNDGNLLYLRGDYAAALERYEASLVLQRATGSRRGEASALGNCGMVLVSLGDYPTAEALLRQAAAIEESIGYDSGLAEGLAHLARALAGQDRLEEAKFTAERSLSLADRIGDRYSGVLARLVLGWVLVLLGQADEGRALEAEAAGIARDTGLVHGVILGLAFQAVAHLAAAQADLAVRCSRQAVGLLEQYGCIEGPEEAVLLVHFQALEARGHARAAARARRRFLEELELKARRIPRPVQRNAYLASWSVDRAPHL
ncbi:MAG TPA: tetratricopeptide repeat protein, partial [Anaerolineales bacterium]|nr:tetratricopeptide repeat protein [Anaerolineales bacterium]